MSAAGTPKASEAAVAAVQDAIRVAKHEHRAIRAVTCACGGWWSMAHQEEHVAVAAADAAAPHIAAQALRDAADELPAHTEGADRSGTARWTERHRDVYSLAIEESQVALRERADRIEAP